MTAFALEPGVVLAGKYRVEKVLGRGGMGVVASAYHLQLEQRMAIKLMLPHAMQNPEAVTRFLREARAAARISSEHVVRVFDVGALSTGEPYIAMEYLEGADFSEILARDGRISASDAVGYILQACEALAEAHAAGIIHRDLKPGNLYLARRVDGQRLIKVLDFGISKMTDAKAASSGAPMTATSALMGSPLYMSPEQMASSKSVDARSDVWALGVVLYEMLSGTPPFNAETLPQVCAMILSEQPPALAKLVPGIPAPLIAVVERCLEKQPAARFQSVAEFARALLPLASDRGQQSVERISRVLGVTVTGQPSSPSVRPTETTGSPAMPVNASYGHTRTAATWGTTQSPPAPRARMKLWLAAASLLASAIAGGAVWFLRHAPAPVAQALPTPSAPAVTVAHAEPATVSAEAAGAPAPAQAALVAAGSSSGVSSSAAPPHAAPLRPPAPVKARAVSPPPKAPEPVTAPEPVKGTPPKAIAPSPALAPVTAVPGTSVQAAPPPIRSRL